MKIAIFSDTFYPQVNGVANSLKKLTEHLSKKGIVYEVFTPVIKDTPTYPNIHQFFSLPFFLYPECRTVIANPQKIKEKIKKFKPDLIHVATPYCMGLYGVYCAKKLNIPMVASYHTHFDTYLEYYKVPALSPLLWRYLKWFHKPFESIFVPSNETKKKLEKEGFHSLEVWGRGVDAKRFHPHYNQEYVRKKYNVKEKYLLLFVGRFAPEKDLSTLMNTIEKLPVSLQKQVHWLLVGNGPSFPEVKQRVAEKNNVTLTGYLVGNELAQVYSASDLFVFPSSSETFGNVVLEALASGTPAVVSNLGGVKEIVQNDRTGKICVPKQEESFIQAINELLDDDQKLINMKIEARNYALNQSWDRIMDSLIEKYYKTLFENSLEQEKYLKI